MTAVGHAGEDLRRSGRRSDPLGRYYTSPEVSSSLVELICAPRPKLILELGSGSGALCAAAARRWQEARIITVDTDTCANKRQSARNPDQHAKHSHFVHDALDQDLPNKVGLSLGTVDVAVCNPPYIRPRWRAGFGSILEDAGLSGALASLHDAGADLLFLAQNLRLLRRKGKLGLILPDGLVTAERFSGVRRVLLRQHLIEQVVQLPRGVFKGTEAQTYLAVLSKMAGETEQLTLRQMGPDGQLSTAVKVPQEVAAKRMDYSFHSQLRSGHLLTDGCRGMLLGEALTDLVRGSICSSEISAFATPVFHLGDFAKLRCDKDLRIVPNHFSVRNRAVTTISRNAQLALPGDILLARVGRNLHDKLAMVVHGPCVISDCIFALRATEEHRGRLYRFLESDAGKLALARSAHGVAARFLSKQNLLDIQF
ncbi:N-6 DNA methylase [Aquimonas voraii]|uniref:site-specific DNA-methyltransferase (adenine-specific) n=1 Tax=Aquimonas voraii TaxID=265719 RepID=A0A1G7AA99_9GAMM|nr:N-6 DNA methylase [Aquimonas voraii]SDE11427.1 type I restriction enzyme M protein [Aquimonas voraii]